jgi:formate dehydrogenase subunit beta
VGTVGVEGERVLLIPHNKRGEALLAALGLGMDQPLDEWSKAAEEARGRKTAAREKAHADMLARTHGLDNLMGVLRDCINCHNCQRVCPICYCKQCYFDAPSVRADATDHLDRARRSGSIRLPSDVLLFHLGRMSHMVLSCVSCGACEDACPMDVPVSQLFSMVGREAQRTFDYVPGRSLDEARPLSTYRLQELTEVED